HIETNSPTTTRVKERTLRTNGPQPISTGKSVQRLEERRERYEVSGELVAPREIEYVIDEYPAVNLVQVIGVPDSLTTEIGAAFIGLHDTEQLSRKATAGWCDSQFACFKIPRLIWFIKAADWPVTSTG